jgi:hypothetical protein
MHCRRGMSTAGADGSESRSRRRRRGGGESRGGPVASFQRLSLFWGGEGGLHQYSRRGSDHIVVESDAASGKTMSFRGARGGGGGGDRGGGGSSLKSGSGVWSTLTEGSSVGGFAGTTSKPGSVFVAEGGAGSGVVGSSVGRESPKPPLVGSPNSASASASVVEESHAPTTLVVGNSCNSSLSNENTATNTLGSKSLPPKSTTKSQDSNRTSKLLDSAKTFKAKLRISRTWSAAPSANSNSNSNSNLNANANTSPTISTSPPPLTHRVSLGSLLNEGKEKIKRSVYKLKSHRRFSLASSPLQTTTSTAFPTTLSQRPKSSVSFRRQSRFFAPSPSEQELAPERPNPTLKTVMELKGHAGDVYCLCVIDDGARVVSGSLDHTVKVSKQTPLIFFYLLSIFFLKTIKLNTQVWNLMSGECEHTFYGHTDTVTCLTSSGSYIYSGSLDRTVRRKFSPTPEKSMSRIRRTEMNGIRMELQVI